MTKDISSHRTSQHDAAIEILLCDQDTTWTTEIVWVRESLKRCLIADFDAEGGFVRDDLPRHFHPHNRSIVYYGIWS